ncbi:VOC family protein [Ktedonosporobacter rubrisoli]|uniref:VOC family protein n=1 Tax=Ktedonosporobacter rubrisoli TaxID=2509675 RepID=A0A4P6JLI6_KTERU|nr:VOC family protein [Ktedonosporobacter rubrisoli]QBD75890.1 VOC family protein [Ktedonosporobacter rubrisoli]
MSAKNSYMRYGYCAVRPYLYGRLDLPDFLKQTFGAEEIERTATGKQGFHVEMKLEDSIMELEIGDECAHTTQGSTYVYVESVDATYQRALQAGATSLAEPQDKPYGERNAGFKDASGNTWWIGTYIGSHSN